MKYFRQPYGTLHLWFSVGINYILLPLLEITVANVNLKITILSDKLASGRCGSEHGLSFLIEADRRILFDTGSSDLFLRNAKIIGIDLETVDTVVLSHGHYDHGNGLQFVSGKTIVIHPNAFAQRISERSGRNISIAVDRESVESRNRIVETRGPLWLSEQIAYLGEIPRIVPFEMECSTPFHFTDGTPDPVIDDSGLAVKTENGLIVISGCAHSGICNIVEQARKVTGTSNVYGVIGGFHLTEIDERLQQTIDYLKNIGTEYVMPSHCTSDDVRAIFRNEFFSPEVKTGLAFEF